MTDTVDELKDFLLAALEEKKAHNIIVVDLLGKTDFTRYMIFANGTSVKNISSIAEFVKIEMKKEYNFIANIEGLGGSGWVIVDCGDVIVHIFHPESRSIIKAEEIWLKK